QLRLIISSVVGHFSVSVVARIVLLYYQYFRIEMRDDDFLFMAANLLRESFYGWITSTPLSFALERCFATIFSSWYD
ncbi:hypothetical protein PFISCL1PPCAC_1670, partial [Pristionchus fissidentatus]